MMLLLVRACAFAQETNLPLTMEKATKRESMQFFSVGRSKTAFGLVMEVNLKPGGKAIFAELFGEPVEIAPG